MDSKTKAIQQLYGILSDLDRPDVPKRDIGQSVLQVIGTLSEAETKNEQYRKAMEEIEAIQMFAPLEKDTWRQAVQYYLDRLKGAEHDDLNDLEKWFVNQDPDSIVKRLDDFRRNNEYIKKQDSH